MYQSTASRDSYLKLDGQLLQLLPLLTQLSLHRLTKSTPSLSPTTTREATHPQGLQLLLQHVRLVADHLHIQPHHTHDVAQRQRSTKQQGVRFAEQTCRLWPALSFSCSATCTRAVSCLSVSVCTCDQPTAKTQAEMTRAVERRSTYHVLAEGFSRLGLLLLGLVLRGSQLAPRAPPQEL